MELRLNGLRVAYTASGAGRPVLLLHGWGAERGLMEPLRAAIADICYAVCPDLPGFGQSEAPPAAWGVEEYADFIRRFCAALGLEKPLILGHSFGGRLAIALGAAGGAGKLILVDAAGIRPRRGLGYYPRVYAYQAAKRLLWLAGAERRARLLAAWRNKRGSADYAAAQGVMREILVKTVNCDLKPLLPRIKAPVLLIWGENDTATPLADGRLMEKLIPDAGLVVFAGAGHYPFLDQPSRFYAVVRCFIEQD